MLRSLRLAGASSWRSKLSNVITPGYDTDVLVVGAGPTGMALAASLAVRGVSTILLDAQAEGANTSRAAVIHASTLESLQPIGVVDELIREGLPIRRFAIRDRDRLLLPIGFEQLLSPYNYVLMLSQAVTERVLRDKLQELRVPVLRPRRLVRIDQDDDGVLATLESGGRYRARFLVGADGMHSAVRESMGIAFEGNTYSESFVLADVKLAGGQPTDEVTLYFSPPGMVVVAPLPDGNSRIVAAVDEAPEQPEASWIQALLDARGPQAMPARVEEMVWSSRFRVHHRLASQYRKGRVMLAGDAAHVHSPAGGQGMNIGIQDAVCLADVLARAVSGYMLALDEYEKSRRPVAEDVLKMSGRLTSFATAKGEKRWLRNLILRLFSLLPPLRHRLADQLSGLVYRESA